MNNSVGEQFPSVGQLEAELNRQRNQKKHRKVFMSTLYVLITVAAVAVLVATLWMPVFEIYGNSMSPTLSGGDIAVAVKTKNLQAGDLCAFYVNDKILVKRVIACPGDWVSMTQEGAVYVNNRKLEEPYVLQPALGNCDVTFPLQVPADQYFVLGDHRAQSADSRHADVGCIAKERIVGKLLFCIWPINSIEFF